jgi:hypothetical protein
MTAGWRERRSGRASGAVAAVAAVLLLAACTPAGPSAGAGAVPPQQTALPGQVTTLDTMPALRSVFNHDQGDPRLVLIFSPT